LLGLLTLLIVYCAARDLLPESPVVASGAALLLAMIPDRMLAVSRVNNDALLEVFAALFFWIGLRAFRKGLTPWRAAELGLTFGLAVCTKITAGTLAVGLPIVFWHARRERWRLYAPLVTAAVASLLVVPLLVHNWHVYRDYTGFAGFNKVSFLVAPPLTLHTLRVLAEDLLRNYWLVDWWPSSAVHRALFIGLSALLAALCLRAVVTIRLRWRFAEVGAEAVRQRAVASLFLVSIGVSLALGVYSYLTGHVPAFRGRFLLTVSLPIAILVSDGLFALRSRWAWLVVPCLLSAMDAATAFGNMMPFHYGAGWATGHSALPRMFRATGGVLAALWLTSSVAALILVYRQADDEAALRSSPAE
jgi:hypothetical protein